MKKNAIFQKPDGSVRKMGGYKSQKAPAGTPVYASKRSSSELPSKVDLRKHMTKVENQDETSTCVAHATSAAYEYLVKKHQGKSLDVSCLFIYYNARSLDEDYEELEDEGTYMRCAVEALKQYGACLEEEWEFDTDALNDEPPKEAYEKAKNFLVEEAELVPLTLEAWKSALAEGYPIIFGISTFESFDIHKTPGRVPSPTRYEIENEEDVGHAMLCVGYSDKDKVFIIRNSFGTEWGDKGYGYVDYDYILSTQYNDEDCWIIKRLQDEPIDEDTWSNEDEYETVLGDYKTELANMSDEDYAAMLDDMGDYPLEYRLAILFIHVANAEEDFSRTERKEVLKYIQKTFQKLGSQYEAKKVLEYVWHNNKADEELLEETVELLGEYLSEEMLATIAQDLESVVGSDELSEEESEFLDYIRDEWEITGEEEDDDE